MLYSQYPWVLSQLIGKLFLFSIILTPEIEGCGIKFTPNNMITASKTSN
jgi:hypothetical protein